MKRTLLSVFALLAFTVGSPAQYWAVQNSNLAPSRVISDIMAVNAAIVWAAAYDGNNPANPCQDFTKTLNGGLNWTPGTITAASSTSIANIVAVDGSKAWAITYYPSGTGANDGVWYTSDGGTSWTHQTTAAFSNSASSPNCIWFWNANNGYCMGDPVSGEFEIYTTTNGGATWTPVPGADIPDPIPGEYSIFGYQSVVGNTVWFGTSLGRIYKSADQGLHWTAALCIQLDGYWVSPFFKDQNYGLIMDRDVYTTGFLAYSDDGGSNFHPRNNTGNTFTNDMAYVPGTISTWVTTGNDLLNARAGIAYSFDDGSTWNDMAGTIGTQYFATAWVDNATAWAGGIVTASGSEGMYRFTGILEAPTPDFTSDLTSVYLGGSVNFTDLSTGGITAWHWSFQGGVPASSTIQNPSMVFYTAPGFNNVSLRVTNQWGEATLLKTGYIYVGGVGVNELSPANITVHPNPVHDVMNIQSSMNIEEIRLYNIAGRMVHEQKAGNSDFTVDVSNLAAGIYLLKVKTAEGYINKRIVVE